MYKIATVSFRKRQPTVHDKPQKFLHDLSTLPIYCQPSKQLNTTQCVNKQPYHDIELKISQGSKGPEVRLEFY